MTGAMHVTTTTTNDTRPTPTPITDRSGVDPDRPRPPAFTLDVPTLIVVPWPDDVVERVGHDPRSVYAELFWLSVFGPTSLWLLRRVVTGLDEYPGGYELDLDQTAGSLGLTFSPGCANPFARAVHRLVMFGGAHEITGGLAVRRKLPPVPARQLRRMPNHLQQAHLAWHQHATTDGEEWERATLLATAMRRAGDPADAIERQLLGLGITPPVANAIGSARAA
jgi:hypothetical protein